MEHRIVLENGQTKHIRSIGRALLDEQGRLAGIFGTIQDISERKRAEHTLASREKMMRAMAEASYDALIMIDPADKILFWSPAAEKMFGWTQKEALGKQLHRLIVPKAARQKAEDGLAAFARSGEGPVLNAVTEILAQRKNGEFFHAERSVSSFKSGDEYHAVGNLRDITERRTARRRLQSFAERAALASEAGGVGIWEWNIHTNRLTWDRRMHELYGLAPETFTGRYEDWKNCVHPEDIEAAEKGLEKAIETSGEWRWEFRIIRPDNQVRHIQAAGRARGEEKGRVTGMVGINQDITQSKIIHEQLRRMATTDSLTGILNRRRFMELAEGELERCKRYFRPLSLIMLDADRFKAINDVHGHDVGDTVLRAIAQTAQSVLREVDIFGRIGGEEFAVILPETGLDAAAEAAERLRIAVADQSVGLKDGAKVLFTISLGVAELKDPKTGLGELLKQADTALYQAKNSGRNMVKRA